MFIALFVGVLFTALTARRNTEKVVQKNEAESVETSYFQKVHYFKMEEHSPMAELEAEFLDIKSNNVLGFVSPKGVILEEGREINYTADSGKMNLKKKHLVLAGEVNIKDQDSRYSSDRFEYDGLISTMTANGNVKSNIFDPKTQDNIKVKSQEMVSNIKTKKIDLRGGVKGEIIRNRRYEGKIKFSSGELEMDQQESYMKLDKYVKIQRNKMNLTAGNGEIFLENFNKKLKYYVLYDDVRLEESIRLNSGIFQKRRAFAEKLEAEQRTGKLILTGAPRVEQGSDRIKGYQITLREAVEMIEVDDSQSSFKLKKDK